MKTFSEQFKDRAMGLCFCFPVTALLLAHAVNEVTSHQVSLFEFIVRPATLIIFGMGIECPIMILAGIRQQIEVSKEAIAWFKEFPDATLIKREPSDYGIDESVVDSLNRDFGSGYSKNTSDRIDLYQVVCPNPPLPGQFKAFSIGFTMKRIVLIRDEPGKLTEFSKFILLHELGHADPLTTAFTLLQYSTAASLMVLAFVICVVSKPLYFGIIVYGIYAFSRRAYVNNRIGYILSELSADQFAAFHIKDSNKLLNISSRLEKYFANQFAMKQRIEQLKSFADPKRKADALDLPMISWIGAVIAFGAIQLISLKWDKTNQGLLLVLPLTVAFISMILRQKMDKERSELYFELEHLLVCRQNLHKRLKSPIHSSGDS